MAISRGMREAARVTVCKVLVGVVAMAALLALTPAESNADLSFDPHFGKGGVTMIPGTGRAHDIAKAPGGKTVVVGLVYGSPWISFVARLNPDGSLDSSFGNGGTVFEPVPGPPLPGFFQLPVHDVEVQSDGKVVLGGAYQTAMADAQFAVVRLNADGTFDTGFGSGGRALFDLGKYGTVTELALHAGGKIAAAGYGFDYTPNLTVSNVIVQLNGNGTPDTAFSDDGIVVSSEISGSLTGPEDIATQPDGKVLLLDDPSHKFELKRFDAHGALDSGFGSGGVARFPGFGSSIATTIAVDAVGRIWLGGARNNEVTVYRFLPNGMIDKSFDKDGASGSRFMRLTYKYDLALRDDGTAVVAGTLIDKGQLPAGSDPSSIYVAGFERSGDTDLGIGPNEWPAAAGTFEFPSTAKAPWGAEEAEFDARNGLVLAGFNGLTGMAARLVEVNVSIRTAKRVARNRFRRIRGRVTDPASSVQIAIRRDLKVQQGKKSANKALSLAATRCRWLAPDRRRFGRSLMNERCRSHQVWIKAKVARSGRWQLNFPDTLPAGRYTLFARSLNSAGKRSDLSSQSVKLTR